MIGLDAWRDVDLDRPELGARVWWTGAEVRLGRRVYRVRWTR